MVNKIWAGMSTINLIFRVGMSTTNVYHKFEFWKFLKKVEIFKPVVHPRYPCGEE